MSTFEEEIEKYRKIHSGESQVIVQNGKTSQFVNNEHFANGQVSTRIGLPHIINVRNIKQRAISILDYGCGQALHTFKPLTRLTSKMWARRNVFEMMDGGIQCYYCYDPAVTNFNVKPSPGSLFDYVQMIDVGEHIPEEHVEDVVREALSYVKQDGLFVISVSSEPSYHFFSEDGAPQNNLHITLKPMDWWHDLVLRNSQDKAFIVYCQKYNKEKDRYDTHNRFRSSEHVSAAPPPHNILEPYADMIK